MNPDDMLSANHEYLAVRVASAGDEAGNGDTWPTEKFRNMELLPAWFKGYINQVGGRNADEIDPATPDTGAFTRVATVALSSISFTALGAIASTLWFIRRRK